jgi:hypothetical protein
MSVNSPSKLRITTGTPDPNNPTAETDCPTCDITARGFFLGPDVVINAGGSVNIPNFIGGTVSLIARAGDVNLNQAVVSNMLTLSAGRDVKLNAAGCSSIDSGAYCGLVWVGPGPGGSATSGPFTVTAGRDIITDDYSPIHISNAQTMTLISGDRVAGGDVTLNLLETLGAVNITAKTGNITLIQPIGPAITPAFDPDPNHNGVSSLSLSAPSGFISMTGAWAQGAITIATGGNLTSSREIHSVSGPSAVSISAANGTSGIVSNPIGTQNDLVLLGIPLGIVSPGPTVPPPTAPGIASSFAPGLPTLSEIFVVDQPGSPGGAIAPGATGAIVALPGSPLGGSVGSPAGSSDEDTVDAASAQRAAQQTSTAASTAGDDATLIALASSDSDAAGQRAVLCPAGVTPGSSLQRKDAAGRAVTVTCK